jgi:hypothetical protein
MFDFTTVSRIQSPIPYPASPFHSISIRMLTKTQRTCCESQHRDPVYESLILHCDSDGRMSIAAA